MKNLVEFLVRTIIRWVFGIRVEVDRLDVKNKATSEENKED